MLIRNNEVNILRYLPNFLSKDKTFKSVGNICSNEHEILRILVNELSEQMFVKTATWGLDEWERVLDIKKQGDYEARRKKILLKLQSNQTSTLEFMTNVAKRYFNAKTRLYINEENLKNSFKIIADNISYDYDGLIEAIEMYKPAHLAYLISHLLDGDIKKYHGLYMRTLRKSNILPNIDVSFDNVSSNKYYGGTVAVARQTKIN